RITPPVTYPATISQFGSGETSSSSMCLPNFAPKNDDTTFAYDCVITDIMINPGAMYCMYGTSPMFPTRRPTRLPKITKYSVAVTAEGTSVWPQMRMIRPYSRITMVLYPTHRMCPMSIGGGATCSAATVF